MKYKKGQTSTGLLVAISTVVVAIVALIALILIAPKMESRTYNKLTGAETTWWDAFWVELRVQEQPNK